MGERLVPLSRTKLIRRFKDLGWSGPHRGRKHDTIYKEGRRPLTIPNNHSGDVSKGLIAELLKQAGLSRAEWCTC